MSGNQNQELPDDPGEFPPIGQYDLVPGPGDAGYVPPAADGEDPEAAFDPAESEADVAPEAGESETDLAPEHDGATDPDDAAIEAGEIEPEPLTFFGQDIEPDTEPDEPDEE